jgi:uncharacterized protein DUF3617
MRHASLVLLTLILTATFAQAEEIPKRKSGLWEVKRTSTLSRGQTRVYQLCIGQATDNALPQLAESMSNENCATSKVLRQGDKLLVDAVCKLRGPQTTATTHGVITGNFDSAYRIESKSTFDPPLRGRAESSAVLEGKWTGPCKPDQHPGDVILPNGMKVSAETVSRETGHERRDARAAKGKPDKPDTPIPTK